MRGQKNNTEQKLIPLHFRQHTALPLRPRKCRFALVNRADRLAEAIYLLKSHGLEPKRLQFVSGTPGGKPYLILIESTKGGKPGLELLPPAVNAAGA